MPIQNFITIDEIGLLPGATEPTETSGLLNLDYSKTHQLIQFSDLTTQELPDLNLSSDGTPLFYTFENNQHDLIAKRGANGELVFKASITDEGSFQFSLYQVIDRETPQNMLASDSVQYKVNHDYGDHQLAGIAYQLQTLPNHPYQLGFYYSPQENVNFDVDLYWGNQHLYTISSNISGSTGFNFPLMSSLDSSTELKFVSQNDVPLTSILQNITLVDSGQHQLPLPFHFNADGENTTFTVNVTTDIPIVTSNDPFNIVYEQSVYQNIIVEGSKGKDALTKINLDSLFDSMNIAHEHRHVEVVHREASNYYTVHISDSSELVHNPIIVADIRLSVEGEDNGLDTFYRHVQFDI